MMMMILVAELCRDAAVCICGSRYTCRWRCGHAGIGFRSCRNCLPACCAAA